VSICVFSDIPSPQWGLYLECPLLRRGIGPELLHDISATIGQQASYPCNMSVSGSAGEAVRILAIVLIIGGFFTRHGANLLAPSLGSTAFPDQYSTGHIRTHP